MDVYTRSIGPTSIPEVPYVLVVDDEINSVRPLGDLIRIAGFATVGAQSATDALACCWHRRPLVLVTDLVMPGPDGRDLARRVRRRDPSIPIVLITGQNLDDPAWSIPEGLFAAIFPKPLDLDRFLATLGRMTERRGVTNPSGGESAESARWGDRLPLRPRGSPWHARSSPWRSTPRTRA